MNRADNISLPGISVIIITKNEEGNIRECLDSFVKIDYPPTLFEIIVVDASTDQTPSIVLEYEAVRLIKSEAGFSRQRNEGLKAARFDIIAFADADTIIPASWLKGIASGFITHPRAVGLGGDAFPPPGSAWLDRCIGAVGHPGGGGIGLDANTVIDSDGITFISGCNGAFYKSTLEGVGGYNLDFDSGGEDVDMSRRLYLKGHCLQYEPQMKIYHKPHGPLANYAKWNIGVGVTKYSLNKPRLINIALEKGSPMWCFFGLALLVLAFWFHPFLALAGLMGVHLILQFALRMWSRPYKLLLQRRRLVGLDKLSIWFVVPILIYIRQLFMNVGMWKMWGKQRRVKSDG